MTTEHFNRKLAWAAQLGAWSHSSVAATFDININAVYNAGSARYEPHRSFEQHIRLDPYDYASKYIPTWLFEALDEGRRMRKELEEPPNVTPNNAFLLHGWRNRLVERQTGTHKFNNKLRMAVLLEMSRLKPNGVPQWSALDVIRAFKLERSTVDNMRYGTGGLYQAFHDEYRRHRMQFLRQNDLSPLIINMTLVDAYDAKLALGDDVMDEDDEELRPEYLRWEAIYESHKHAINEMVDGYFNRLVFDALQQNQTLDNRQDEWFIEKRARVMVKGR
jgi:hypothetical protein